MNKKYVVTGGAGFIGSNLVEGLLKANCDVIVIDDLSTGSLENLPVEVPVLMNVSDLDNIKHVDGIFHLGAPSSSPMYRRSPNLVATSINEFIRILEFCKREGVRLIVGSSSSVYNLNTTPWEETMSIYPTDLYTEVRYSWERLAEVYASLSGVEVLLLRQFSVYGPHETFKGCYANLVTQLLWSAQGGETFRVYGDGSQTRDLIYVTDVVEAYILAMNATHIKYGMFNVGTGRSISVNEMAKAVGATVNYVTNPIQNYIAHTLADTFRTETLLNFKAHISFEEGVELLREAY